MVLVAKCAQLAEALAELVVVVVVVVAMDIENSANVCLCLS